MSITQAQQRALQTIAANGGIPVSEYRAHKLQPKTVDALERDGLVDFDDREFDGVETPFVIVTDDAAEHLDGVVDATTPKETPDAEPAESAGVVVLGKSLTIPQRMSDKVADQVSIIAAVNADELRTYLDAMPEALRSKALDGGLKKSFNGSPAAKKIQKLIDSGDYPPSAKPSGGRGESIYHRIAGEENVHTGKAFVSLSEEKGFKPGGYVKKEYREIEGEQVVCLRFVENKGD